MRFIIGKPIKHIELFRNGPMYYSDVSKFFDEVLPSVLTELNIEYKVLHIGNKVRHIHQEPNSIYLAWHNYGTMSNIWYLNTSPLVDYLYFDNNGYGPWSEIVDECKYQIPVELVRKDVNKFCDEYIKTNQTRIHHSAKTRIPKKPYVLVLGQRPDDAVSQFSYIDTTSLVDSVVKAYKGTKYTVCTRPHPLEPIIKYGSTNTLRATGNIHACLANASAVYTVNSSSGLEALLHGKRVFTAGRCDYHWATTTLRTQQDVNDSVEMLDEPIDNDNRLQFLHYYINHHLVNINDRLSVEKKIIRSVMEFRR